MTTHGRRRVWQLCLALAGCCLLGAAGLWLALVGPKMLPQRPAPNPTKGDNQPPPPPDFDARVPTEVYARVLVRAEQRKDHFALSPRRAQPLRELVRAFYEARREAGGLTPAELDQEIDGFPAITLYRSDLKDGVDLVTLTFMLGRPYVYLQFHARPDVLYKFEVPGAEELYGRVVELAKGWRSDLAMFVDELHSGDWYVRKTSLDWLLHFGPRAREALPAVTAMLQDDPDWRVRHTAATVVCELGGDIELVKRFWVRELDSPNKWPRIGALNVLRDRGQELGLLPAALPGLSRCVRDTDPGVRARALDAVRHLGPAARPVLSALVEVLHDGATDPGPISVMGALGAVGPTEESVAALAQFVTAETSEVTAVLRAMELLGDWGEAARGSLPALAQELQRADPWRRHGAAVTLLRLPGESGEAVKVLRKGFASADATERWIAAQSVARSEDAGRHFVPELEKLLKDEDDRVRNAAGRALKNSRKGAGTDPLNQTNAMPEIVGPCARPQQSGRSQVRPAAASSSALCRWKCCNT